MSDSGSEHVALTRSVDAWVRRIGGGNEDLAAEVAVALADLLHAAEATRRELDQLRSADLDDPSASDAALQNAADIAVQLFTELKPHLESLEQHWPKIEDALERLSEPTSRRPAERARTCESSGALGGGRGVNRGLARCAGRPDRRASPARTT